MSNEDFLSEEDKALFRAAAGKVRPLKNRKTAPVTVPNPPLVKKKLTGSHHQKTPRFLSDFIPEAISTNTVLSYCRPDFPGNRMQALRRGKIPWKAKLDLHGLRGEAIAGFLSDFIERNYATGNRCLLIIHGKGGHDNSPPVVKNLVNRYLPQFEEVLAFHSALPKDGGLGAVYVLLKTCQRES